MGLGHDLSHLYLGPRAGEIVLGLGGSISGVAAFKTRDTHWRAIPSQGLKDNLRGWRGTASGSAAPGYVARRCLRLAARTRI